MNSVFGARERWKALGAKVLPLDADAGLALLDLTHFVQDKRGFLFGACGMTKCVAYAEPVQLFG